MRKSFVAVLAFVAGASSISMLAASEKEIHTGRGGSESLVASPDGGGSKVRQGRAEGVVSAVNAATGQVSIQLRNGTTVVVIATSSTKIERNGRHVALTAIKVGDRGEARFGADFVAVKIESTGP